jgi:NitT/TauT family transport system permease protein
MTVTLQSQPVKANQSTDIDVVLGWARKGLLPARRFAAWVVSLIMVIVAWKWAVAHFNVSPAVFPAPDAVLSALLANLGDGTFEHDLSVTLTEVVLGFFLGSFCGFTLALLIAEIKAVRVILYPYIIGFQSVPKTAIAPMFLIWFGFGLESKIALVIISSFFPVMINTLSGLLRTDPDLLDMMHAYCGKRWRVFAMLKLPSALPAVFSGLELAIVSSVIAAVVTEYLGATAGIGYRILSLNTNLDMASEFAALIVLSAAGFVMHALVKQLGRECVYWGGPREGEAKF